MKKTSRAKTPAKVKVLRQSKMQARVKVKDFGSITVPQTRGLLQTS